MQKNNIVETIISNFYQEFLQDIKDYCLTKKIACENNEAMQAYQNVLDYIRNYKKKGEENGK